MTLWSLPAWHRRQYALANFLALLAVGAAEEALRLVAHASVILGAHDVRCGLLQVAARARAARGAPTAS